MQNEVTITCPKCGKPKHWRVVLKLPNAAAQPFHPTPAEFRAVAGNYDGPMTYAWGLNNNAAAAQPANNVLISTCACWR